MQRVYIFLVGMMCVGARLCAASEQAADESGAAVPAAAAVEDIGIPICISVADAGVGEHHMHPCNLWAVRTDGAGGGTFATFIAKPSESLPCTLWELCSEPFDAPEAPAAPCRSGITP
jgi:hypothetical protein